MKNNSERVGFGFALVDMITYGFYPVIAHYFVAQMDPLLFGGIATFVGSIPLLIILKTRRKVKEIYSPSLRKQFFLIVLFTTAANFCFFFGTKLTSGINTGLLLQTQPVHAMILGPLLLGEVIGIDQIISTLMMMLGAGAVVYKGVNSINIGDVLILFTPLFFTFYNVVARKMFRKVSDALVVLAARMFYGGILLTIIALFLNHFSVGEIFIFKNIFAIVFFGCFSALDFYLWLEAIKRLPISKATAVVPVSAAVSFTASIIFLKEAATLNQYLGLFLIIAGLTWLSITQFRTKKN